MVEFRKFLNCFLSVIFVVALGGCDGGSNSKIDELQIANKALVKKYEKDITELNTKHIIEINELQIANKILVSKYEKDIAELFKKHIIEKVLIKLKMRAKSKIQRGIAAIPVIGLASLAVFEKMELDDWKKDHPNGTSEEYACEMYEASQQLMKEEYRDFEKYTDQIYGTSQEFFKKKYDDLKKSYSKMMN